MPLRGAAFVVAGFLLTLLLSAYALETLKFSPGSIIAFRVAMVMIFGALAGYFFVLPQWRRVNDEQVALYLEECEPTLETAILSALEAEKGSSSHSPALARRLVEQAIERCGVIERGRRLEAQPLRRYAIAIAATTAWRCSFSCSDRRICGRARRRCCSWPATCSKPARTASTSSQAARPCRADPIR